MKLTISLLDDLTTQAKASPRLRMNLDLRTSPSDGSQRMLNALEPGTILPIHRHGKSTETVVLPYFCAKSKRITKMKDVLKVSKEQVIEIERYCDEYGITRKQRIEELGLSHTAYCYTRGLLSEDSSVT